MKVTKRENVGSSKKIGFFNGKVVAINPTKDELIKLLNIPEDKQEDIKEKEYTTEIDGEGALRLNFWLEDELTKSKFNLTFTLIDKVQESKTGKLQWVNATGDSTWVDEEKNLAVWFTNFQNKQKEIVGNKSHRKALVGEADLYTFMRSWLSSVDFFKHDTDILLDTKKLMRGNVSELKELMKTDLIGNVTALATVRIVEPKEDEEGDTKEYQGVFNKAFLPGYKFKVLRNLLATKSWGDDKAVKKFIETLEGEYGPRDVFVVDMLQDYDSEAHVPASNESKISEEGSDY